MSNPSGGGNPRFKGPGMQWKTPWKKRAELLPNMPFIEGWIFEGLGGQEAIYGRYPPASLALEGAAGAGGFWRGAVLFIRPGAGVVDQEAIAATKGLSQPAEIGGWRLFVAMDGSLNFEIGDTNGNFVSAKTAAATASVLASSPDQIAPALVVPLLGIFNGDGTTVELHTGDGSVYSASFAGAVYQSPQLGQQVPAFTFGNDQSTTFAPATSLGINGAVGGAGIPSAPQIEQWFADVKTQLATPIIPGVTTNRWICNSYISANAWRIEGPGTVADDINGQDINATSTKPSPFTLTNYPVVFDY